MRFSLLLLLMTLLPGAIYSQCCSVGIPTGGTTNVGIIPEGDIRLNLFYRYSYSGDYFSGDSKSDKGSVETGQYHFAGIMVGYGILPKFMIEAEIGYFPSKKQTFKESAGGGSLEGVGVSNLLVSGKYNVLNKMDNDLELTLGAGVKIPFTSEPQYQDGVLLPPDLQPSTGAFGLAVHGFLNYELSPEYQLFLIHKSEMNFENNQEYRYGNIYITSIFVSHEIFTDLTAMLQIKNEIRGKDIRHGDDVVNTGGYLFVLTPQLVYHFDDMSVGVLYDYPFYKNYQGTQLAISYSFAVTLSYNLSTR